MDRNRVKIAIFSSSDKIGGAASSCYQYMHFLRDAGYDAVEVVIEKTCNDPNVILIPPIPSKKKSYLQRFKNHIVRLITPPIPKRHDVSEETSLDYCFFAYDSDDCCVVPSEWIAKSVPFTPNVVFVGHSYALINSTNIVELKRIWNCQFYMMAVDVGAYTGGCHVHWDCKGYVDGCVNCPAVNTKEGKEKIAVAFDTKLKNYKCANVGVMFSSKWQEYEVNQSMLFNQLPHFKVNPSINLDIFNKKSRGIAKQLFDIPESCIVVLFAAQHIDEKRKGYKYFLESTRLLWRRLSKEEKNNLYFVFAGNMPDDFSLSDDLNLSPNVKFVPYTQELRYLSLIYQAADVFVCPTLEDAGPMMVLESLACGTPVVGFKTGHICDSSIIKDGITGYACEMYDSQMLADGIYCFISMPDDKKKFVSENCCEVMQMSRKDVRAGIFDDFIEHIGL